MAAKEIRMMPQRALRVLVLIWFVLVASTAAAQVLTGSLAGTVRDESGGVLPGATVRANSPSVIGGSVVVTTDEGGGFHLLSLAPGEYSVEIELANFAG